MDREEALKHIKQAWIAAVVSGSMTLLVAGVAVATEEALLGGLIDAWAFIDAAIIFGLGFGIYRKSRAAAVAMLAFFVLNQLFIRLQVGWGSGITLALVFIYFFVQGVRGTFAYHRLETADTPTL